MRERHPQSHIQVVPEADAELIALLRNRVPALLAAYDALKAEQDAVETYIEAERAGASLPEGTGPAIIALCEGRGIQTDRLRAEVEQLTKEAQRYRSAWIDAQGELNDELRAERTRREQAEAALESERARYGVLDSLYDVERRKREQTEEALEDCDHEHERALERATNLEVALRQIAPWLRLLCQTIDRVDILRELLMQERCGAEMLAARAEVALAGGEPTK